MNFVHGKAAQTSAPRILEFSDRGACEHALGQRIEKQLAVAVQSGATTMVLSGGSTPAGIYGQLSRADIPWEKVTFTLSDERWVSRRDPDSNEAMIRKTLLRNRARSARLVGLKTRHGSPAAGLEACDARLAACKWPAAVVLLGMGTDGHTASLFPDDPGLAAALAVSPATRCVVAHPASQKQARMSLSLACLLDSELICLLIFGEAKRRVLQAALADGPVEAMPVRGVLKQQAVPIEVYWAP